MAAAPGLMYDSAAVSSGALTRMRSARTLHFRFASPVYSAPMDDFSWYWNHVATPIVDTMILMIFWNGEWLKQQARTP